MNPVEPERLVAVITACPCLNYTTTRPDMSKAPHRRPHGFVARFPEHVHCIVSALNDAGLMVIEGTK